LLRFARNDENPHFSTSPAIRPYKTSSPPIKSLITTDMPLLIIKSPSRMQALAESLRADGRIIGLVPTMGALHEGHLRLVDIAVEKSDVVVVSVFVNPAQFGPGEDFGRYPRAFKSDCDKLEKRGAHIVFYPSVEDIYPDGYSTYVKVEKMTEILEGARRPVHFRGVTTICARLFNIVKPHLAIFGQKDGQQLAVIRRMVKDLNFDLDIIRGPVVRTKAGVALSSRHSYLSQEGHKKAAVIYKSLQLAQGIIRKGERNAIKIESEMRRMIRSVPGTKIDYISFNRWDDLKPLEKLSGRVMISLVVVIEGVRLLDNAIVKIRA
jgi:pantoate--beta-alanine ligase